MYSPNGEISGLRAVIANCATIDRFEDDIHWMGGCVLTDTLEWGATLPAILAAPPDAATVGGGWFGMWEHRLRNMRFPHENWLRETRRDPYWRHGSVRFDVDRLDCPILAIGGWSDRYSNSVMPLVEARPDICRGIVGPWGHQYPDRGEPGPAIGFQSVALEWWDCWLRSEAPAMPDWPAMRLWRREFDPPQDRLAMRNGMWIGIDRPKQAVQRCFHLGDGELQDCPTGKAVELTVPDDLRHGQCAGDTGYFGRVGGLPLDQAPDDECSLRFDSRQLGADLCIVGRAELSIDLAPEALPAQLALRLCDVAPDGRSNLITRTIVNLELDDGLNGPRDAVPGHRFRVRAKFPTTAYRVAQGHRLRLAIGSSYWPLIWPSGHPSRLRIATCGAELSLPLQADAFRRLKRPFPPAVDLPEGKGCRTSSAGPLRRVGSDVPGDRLRNLWHQPAVTIEFEDIEVSLTYETKTEFSSGAAHADLASCSVSHRIEIRRPDGHARISSSVSMFNSPDGTQVRSEVNVQWNDEAIATLKSGTSV